MKTSYRSLSAWVSRFISFAFFSMFAAVALFLAAPSFLSNTSFAMPTANTRIHDIQGNGAVSPLAGQTVTTSGIVTAVTREGFFIQEPDARIDNDPSTPEAIFVAPLLGLDVGNSVEVTGTVTEFRLPSDPLSQPRTQISVSNPSNVTVLSKNKKLPAPVTLTRDGIDPTGSADQLEKYESMRVLVVNFDVVSPTEGSMNEREGTVSLNGVFYGVILGTPRPFREAGIEASIPVPVPAPLNVPRFDSNPELLRVDSDGQLGTSAAEISAGTEIIDLQGVLDFSSRAYTILPDPGDLHIVHVHVIGGQRSLPQSPNGFTVVTFNLDRFFDSTDDGGKNDVVLTVAAFQTHLNKASLAIRQVLLLPDIIGVQEVENLATLQALADKINADQVREGGPNPNYTAHLVEGNDPEGLNVGFLLKSSRATFVSATQLGKAATFINPASGQPETLNDHPPLRLRAAFTSSAGAGFPVTVIVNHLLSRSGIEGEPGGARVRAKRRAQAEFLANLLQTEQSGAGTHVIAVGDFNSFEFNDGYVDVMGTVTGKPTPADQVILASSDMVNPDFVNVTDRVPASDHYSVISGGNAQALDHILVSQNMLPLLSYVTYWHFNTSVPASDRSISTLAQRVSDHDVPIAYFSFAPVSADLSISASSLPSYSGQGGVEYMVAITNHGPDIVSDAVVKNLLSPSGFSFFNPLSPGTTVTISFTLFTNLPLGTVVNNTVTVSSGVIDPDLSNNSVDVTSVIQPPTPRVLFAQVNGKRLDVSGLGFKSGCVIEIDGKPQKTASSGVPLIPIISAKKGGKKIQPGATVVITVVNPDGTRSAEFMFTRPDQ
jgi:predicted extracellular nuclease